MTHRFGVAHDPVVVARWCALAEQRLAYLTELFNNGRWRRYYSHTAFIENIKEAKAMVAHWRALSTPGHVPEQRTPFLNPDTKAASVPDVVETAPRLDDGTPFPTLFYLTCPRAAAAVSRLESGGLMKDMQQRLTSEPDLRAAQQAAHRDYLGRRAAAAAAAGVAPLPPGMQSAGGMPDRVKCLHALVAHELAVPGANPLGREAADAAGEWWAHGPCVP